MSPIIFTGKKSVTLYLDENLVKRAKELGLNFSKTFELALKKRIELISKEKTRNEDFLIIGGPGGI
ncbi:MAG: type II toxin-antitoxin system CcdA family antitoxin [Candidatus Bathyarchaeia archaeon]